MGGGGGGGLWAPPLQSSMASAWGWDEVCNAIQTKGGLILRITRTQRSVLIWRFWLSSFSSALNFLSLIPAVPGHETGPSHRQSITELQYDTGRVTSGRHRERDGFLGPKEQLADCLWTFSAPHQLFWIPGNPAPTITIQAANLIEPHQFWQEKGFKTRAHFIACDKGSQIWWWNTPQVQKLNCANVCVFCHEVRPHVQWQWSSV